MVLRDGVSGRGTGGRGRRRLAALCVCGAGALGFAGFALANAITVSLTGTGPQPATASVALGDTLTFTNAENVAHILSSKPLGWTSPVIQPTSTYAYVATRAGDWDYQVSDSAGKNRQKGTLVVAKPGAVSLNVAASTISYGRVLVLRGTTPLPGYPVVIEVQAGRAWSPYGAPITPAPDGSFTLSVEPHLQTTYRADVLNGQIVSEAAKIAVKPRLTLRANKRYFKTGEPVKLTAHIVPASAAKSIVIQLFDAHKKHWGKAGSQAVKRAGTVTVLVPARQGWWAVRAVPKQLAKGLTLTYSNHVVVVGVGTPPKHGHHQPKKKKKTAAKTSTTKG